MEIFTFLALNYSDSALQSNYKNTITRVVSRLSEELQRLPSRTYPGPDPHPNPGPDSDLILT